MSRRTLRWLRIPQYVAVGVDLSEEMVSVFLDLGGPAREVGRRTVVASLRPLTIGVMLETQDAIQAATRGSCHLRFVTPDNQVLGVIYLTFTRRIDLGIQQFTLFTVAGSENRCIPTIVRPFQDLYERWRTHRHQKANPFNFQMEHRDLKALFVFYLRPRPVYLVSVQHGAHLNIFPMDLVGPLDSAWFSFALRLTSPAVDLMKHSGRFVASGIDATFKTIAYELGRQHRQLSIELPALPFETCPSPEFGLPAPVAALDVREVSVEHAMEVGSHCLFLTTVTRRSRSAETNGSRQLCHIHGSFAEALSDAGRSVLRA